MTKLEDFYRIEILRIRLVQKQYFDGGDKRKDLIEIDFESGKRLVIIDEKRKCCEQRYISTPTIPEELIGKELRRISVEDLEMDEYTPPNCTRNEAFRGLCDVHFLTTEGNDHTIVFNSYTIHGGHSGFKITAYELKPVKIHEF